MPRTPAGPLHGSQRQHDPTDPGHAQYRPPAHDDPTDPRPRRSRHRGPHPVSATSFAPGHRRTNPITTTQPCCITISCLAASCRKDDVTWHIPHRVPRAALTRRAVPTRGVQPHRGRVRRPRSDDGLLRKSRYRSGVCYGLTVKPVFARSKRRSGFRLGAVRVHPQPVLSRKQCQMF
jgi:hypothetical protein